MVVVGADVHKRTHTFVVVDAVGKKLGHKTVKADGSGHGQAIRWVQAEFAEVIAADPEGLWWGIEDCRHLSARLEIDLLDAGQAVVRVPAKLMAHTRSSARTRGKSDPIDALAVARAVLREPDLPVASHDEASRELKLLVDRRDDLVKERTAMMNRFRWHLHRIDPTADPAPKSLKQVKTRNKLTKLLAPLAGIDARLPRDVLADMTGSPRPSTIWSARSPPWFTVQVPALIELRGCGALSAAKIVGETVGIARFSHEAKYAMHAGVAPIPVWSGRTEGRVRMCKAGNRQLNAALHRIAITQLQRPGPGRDYYEKRLAAGDSTTEALRCLKRRLARVVYQTLKNNPSTTAQACLPTAA